MGDDDWQKVGPADDTKECTFCGETIKKAAIKCRHCGENLTRRRKRSAGESVRKQIEDASNLSLIMGIIGMVACALTLPVAVIKGNEAKRLAERNNMPVPGGATAGIMIGWGCGILNLLFILIMIIFVVVGVVAGVQQGR